jgi:RNA polymerase primary sigma factor
LTGCEAEIVRLYFGLGYEHPLTLEEIGERFNLTRERIRQIKVKALQRLRHVSRSEALRKFLG